MDDWGQINSRSDLGNQYANNFTNTRMAIVFYANEGNEPIHIHCRKGEIERKYWLDSEKFEISEAYAFNMNNKARREIRKIIFHHFEYLEEAWNEFQRRRSQNE